MGVEKQRRVVCETSGLRFQSQVQGAFLRRLVPDGTVGIRRVSETVGQPSTKHQVPDVIHDLYFSARSANYALAPKTPTDG